MLIDDGKRRAEPDVDVGGNEERLIHHCLCIGHEVYQPYTAPFEAGHVVGFELDHDRARVFIRSVTEWKGILLVYQILRVCGPRPATRERRSVAGSASNSLMASSSNGMSSGFCISAATPLSIATG